MNHKSPENSAGQPSSANTDWDILKNVPMSGETATGDFSQYFRELFQEADEAGEIAESFVDDKDIIKSMADASATPEQAQRMRQQVIDAYEQATGATPSPEEEQALPNEFASWMLDHITSRLKDAPEHEIDEDYLQDYRQLTAALGTKYPLDSEGVWQASGFRDDYASRRFLEKHHFADEERNYQERLSRVFPNGSTPDFLKTRSKEMKDYWDEQSRQANLDTLNLFLHTFPNADRVALSPEDISLQKALDDKGLPTDLAFAHDSPLVQNALYHDPRNTGDHYSQALHFVSQNADRLQSAPDRFFANAAKGFEFNGGPDEPRLMGEFCALATSCASPRNYDAQGRPTQEFWNTALLTDAAEATEFVAGGKDKLETIYTPSQRALLNLPDRHAKQALSSWLREQDYPGTLAEQVDAAITPEGKLTKRALDDIQLDGGNGEYLLTAYPELAQQRLSPAALEYLQRDPVDRQAERSQFDLSLLRLDPEDGIKKYHDKKTIQRIKNKLFELSLEPEGREQAEDQFSFLSGQLDKFNQRSPKHPPRLTDIQSQILDNYQHGSIFYRNKYRDAALKLDLDTVPSEELNQEVARQMFADGEYFTLALPKSQSWLPVERSDLLPAQSKVIEVYSNLAHKNRASAGRYADIAKQISPDELTLEKVQRHEDIFNSISESNAIELRRANIELFQDLASSDNYREKFHDIEDVFLRNNLPYAGKVFKTFQILHPDPEKESDNMRRAMHRGILEKLPDHGIVSKESVLFTDLMKAAIDSGNYSMRNYAKSLRDGQKLLDQASDGELDWTNITPEERTKLQSYIDHLGTLYGQTQKGKAANWHPSGDLEKDATALANMFGSTERHNLSDRAVRSFGYLLGIKSLDDLERRLGEKTSAADQRGRERFAKQDFSIQKGDLIKAIDDSYIFDLLQNGIVSKEFLNGEMSTDATPLDADLTKVTQDVDGSVSSALAWKNTHASFNPQRVNLVMKGDDRFISEEEDANSRYDPEKFVLWDNGNSNHGVRVGLPSSAIDFITYDSKDDNDVNRKNYLFSAIAKNGFYIPVVDQETGKCIFTPDDYDQLRRTLSGLERYDGGEFQFADDSDLVTPELGEIAKERVLHSPEVATQQQAIRRHMQDILSQSYANFQGLKDGIDGDLTPGYIELIDTGSTSRGTSIPGGQIDFDFIMRIDAGAYNDPVRKQELENSLRQALMPTRDKSTGNGLRLYGTTVEGIDAPVDLDISLVQRTNRMEFSSDQAVTSRLEAIREQDPVRYELVLANIIKAKQVLKQANAYKPRTSTDTDDPALKGGLGGIGVENWILQNGGSLKVAAERFLEAAEQSGHNWDTFQRAYPIWDSGQNHFIVRNNESRSETIGGSSRMQGLPFDNFVTGNMDAGGFARMTDALRNYLNEINPNS